MLRSLTFRGIPGEVKSLRPTVWKVLLNYFSLVPAEWEKTREAALADY